MTLWWVHFAVLFCLSSAGESVRVSDLKLKDDCNSYMIGDLRVEVKDGKKAWRSILNSREIDNYPPTTPVLVPEILLGNDHNLNIQWSTTLGTDLKLPKWYMLKLTKLRRYTDSLTEVYVLLRLRNRNLRFKSMPTLYFRCVELTNELETYLIVQIWPMPRRQTTKKNVRKRPKPLAVIPQSIQNGTWRHQRSVPGKTICRNIMGQVLCSVEEIAYLSLEPYIPSICHCSGQPKVQLNRLSNGSLHVSVWNLPLYAYNIVVEIHDNNDGYKTVYLAHRSGTNTAKESRTITTDKIFGPGNYTASVDAKCAGDHEDLLGVTTDCPLMDKMQSNTLDVVSYPQSKPNTKLPLNISVLAGVLAVLVCSGAVALCIVCIVKCSRRKKETINGIEIEMTPLSSELQSSHQGSATTGSEAMTRSQGMSSVPVSLAMNETSRETKYVEYGGNLNWADSCNHRTEQRILEMAALKPVKMLLYHPDNQCHIDIVAVLCSALRESCGINLRTDSAENWRDFGEAAGKEFTEIVIIMSRGLLELCRAYEDKAQGIENKFDALRKDRHYEYTPCVAMKKLQTLVQDNPELCQFSLHFVSFESDNDCLEEFFSIYNFLKRTKNCFSYHLRVHVKDGDVQIFQCHSFNRLGVRLCGRPVS